MDKTSPLDRYVADLSVAPVMREVALLARVQGYTQQSLAEKLGYTAPAVIKHFKAARPSAETVRTYSRALGVSEEYLSFFVTPRQSLSRERLKHWRNVLKDRLEYYERDKLFSKGATKTVLAALSTLTEPQRLASLDAFIVGEYRSQHHVRWTPWHRTRFKDASSLEVFAEAISPYFDLSSLLREPTQGEGFLLLLWLSAISDLSIEHADLLCDFAKLLRAREGATVAELDHMTEYLKSDEAYLDTVRRRTSK